jgi:hypothetical protein
VRFVEERLRWDPPTHTLFRVTKKEAAIGAEFIPPGSFVMVMLAAANRDPSVFAELQLARLGTDPATAPRCLNHARPR